MYAYWAGQEMKRMQNNANLASFKQNGMVFYAAFVSHPPHAVLIC